MKTSRKTAHLLAGSIMTAATIIGGAGVAAAADAPRAALEGEPAAASYYKVVFEDILVSSYDVNGSAETEDLSAVFVKIKHRAVDGEQAGALDAFVKYHANVSLMRH